MGERLTRRRALRTALGGFSGPFEDVVWHVEEVDVGTGDHRTAGLDRFDPGEVKSSRDLAGLEKGGWVSIRYKIRNVL